MSNLQDWEASLGKNTETKPHLRKMRSRTKSADLSNIRKAANEIAQTPSSPQLNYNSDHGPDLHASSLIKDASSDASESTDETSGSKDKDSQKPVAKLRRTLSERFRRENRISAPEVVPVDDHVHKALRQGTTVKHMNKMLKKMSHIDQMDSKGQSCLHLCASRGDNEICKLLLKRSANINLKDTRGFTPLHCSAIENRLNTCMFLLNSKGIDVTCTNNENSNTLHYLVRIPVTEDNVVLYRLVLDTLISKGIDINARNSHGEAPIHFACMKSNIHTVAFLLERGVDCNSQTHLGETPLHYAIRAGCLKLVRILMENGADPTVCAADGSTPVDVAEQYQCTDILDCLQAIIEEEIECQTSKDLSVLSARARTNESHVTRAGWLEVLWKKDSWQKCWALLNNQRIICYHDDTKIGDTILELLLSAAEITAEEGTVISDETSEQLWCFTVSEPGSLPISFATTTPEGREGWIEILKQAVQSRTKLSSVYEKLKNLSKPRKRLRARERNIAFHNCQEGTRILVAGTKSGSKDEFLRLLLLTLDQSAASLSEIIDIDDENIIRNLVKFFLHHGVLLDFLKASVTHDIRKTTMGETLFREMSLSTRMLSIYLEMDEGREYLRSVAAELVSSISSIDNSLEVNPNNVGGGERVNFRANLEKIVDMSQKFLDRVLSSASRCPLIFRELMLHIKTRVDSVFPNMTHAVVGGFVFLRFLCPAIVTPHKFGLTSKCPDKNSLRVCVLITKLLQSVSNGVEFDGSKEEYMLRLNPFIKRNRLYVNVFFDNLTNPIGIEQQKNLVGKRFFQLSKDELNDIERQIFSKITVAKDRMVSLLTTPSVSRIPNSDSDDENSAVEADEI